MSVCKNGSAFQYLTDNNRITETESWHLLHDVAEGLAYLHAKTPPVIHQDIKPDNILINDENRYMITDFGISARIRSTLRRNQGQESSGGTLAYMGPERFAEKPLIVATSDIWSLGMSVYELSTGLVLWEGMGGCVQLNGARIPDLDNGYSPQLDQFLHACLSLNTWDRPTAQQAYNYANSMLRQEVNHPHSPSAVHASTPPLPPAPPPPAPPLSNPRPPPSAAP